MDLDAIRRVERIYRDRLRSEPCDTLSRVRLAWCLFALSLHEAGRESAYAALRSQQLPDAANLEEASFLLPEVAATSLLDDCLRQTYAAIHLSQSRREQQDAAELQALVRLVSGEAPLARAENWAKEILTAIVSDIGEDQHSPWDRSSFEDSEIPYEITLLDYSD